MRLLATILLSLVLVGCVTGYAHEAPAGVYPVGALSGLPTVFVGWTFLF